MDRKDLSLELAVLKSDRKSGIITAIANTGNNVDRQRDDMAPGCWAKVISEGQQPAFCWGHDIKDIRGKVIRLEELVPGDPRIPLNRQGGKAGGTASALLAEIQCAMETQAGHDAFVLLDGGFVKELSVQFNNAPEDEEVDRKGVRHVKLVDELFEISAVLKGASYGTAVLASKAFVDVDASTLKSAIDLLTQALAAKDGKGDDPMAALQTIHDMAISVGAKCDTGKAAEPVEIKSDDPDPQPEAIKPDEPIPTAAALDVTALTANVIAFARTLGAFKGDQYSQGESHA